MTKSTKKAGLVVKSSLKSGGVGLNHNRALKKTGLTVKSSVKVGGVGLNHSRTLLG
jgi:hypothetical protein